MRIAIGQLWQETNTFNPLPTTRQDFEDFGVVRADEIVARFHDTNELGGFIQSLRRWPQQPEIVALARLPAWPSGRATRDTLLWLRDELVVALRPAMPLDGVLLALHGAMVADGFVDVEGEILAAVRDVLGPTTPLVATLDLHANVTERMARAADALVVYHTAPHVDVFETGQRAAELLRRIVVEGARPVTALAKIPAVVPAEWANTQDPASVSYVFKTHLAQLEAEPGVLAAGLATVQPWLDIPELGSSVVIVTDGDPQRAAGACRELADEFWRRRRDYLGTLVPLAEAVRRAHDNRTGLTVLADSSDATTSGAPGDSTWLLAELLKYDWPRPALVTLVSPQVVERAHELAAGADFRGLVGGVRDSRFSQPIALAARVERLFEARFVLSGHLGRNLPIDMGRSAVLRHGNVLVVVTARSGPHFAPQLFQTAGLDPLAAQVLVAKSPCGFRAAYAPVAREILVVAAPGCAPADFWHYDYPHIDRPKWPWDEIDQWHAQPVLFSR